MFPVHLASLIGRLSHGGIKAALSIKRSLEYAIKGTEDTHLMSIEYLTAVPVQSKRVHLKKLEGSLGKLEYLA